MPVPIQTASDVADDFLALQFVIQQMISQISTAAPVRVVSCTNSGGLSPYGFVDVALLVNQVAGDGQSIPHGTLYRVPYSRLQGGTNAVILDPQPNDIGVVVFGERDISSVKADPTQAVSNSQAGKGGAPPGSARQYNKADGLYIGGILNAVPVQYVQFSAEGITLVSPTKVTVQAPEIELDGPVHITGAVTGDSTAVFSGDVTGAGISLQTHDHSGVQTGGGNTGPPNP